MTPTEEFTPGGRRAPRPKVVETCIACGETLGAGYAGCSRCRDAIESIWRADWQALLDEEGIQPGTADEELLARVVVAEPERHPWTVVDSAMSLLKCGTCGGELGERYSDCPECGLIFGASILSEVGASGAATANEHALHIGRWVLRYPQRHPPNSVIGWKLSMPRILTGWLPTTAEAQRSAALIKAGRIDEVRRDLEAVDREISSRAKNS